MHSFKGDILVVKEYGSKEITYYLSDILGSNSLLTDKDGNPTMLTKYDEFGNSYYEWRESADTDNSYKYTGKPLDKETGLYYYGARYYNPEWGRWVSRDIYLGNIKTTQILNRYLYVDNNPLIYIDEKGYVKVEPFITLGKDLSKILSIKQWGGEYRFKGSNLFTVIREGIWELKELDPLSKIIYVIKLIRLAKKDQWDEFAKTVPEGMPYYSFVKECILAAKDAVLRKELTKTAKELYPQLFETLGKYADITSPLLIFKDENVIKDIINQSNLGEKEKEALLNSLEQAKEKGEEYKGKTKWEKIGDLSDPDK